MSYFSKINFIKHEFEHNKFIIYLMFFFLFWVILVLVSFNYYHTESFIEYPRNMLYDNRTFGINIYNDPCTIITNSQFRNYVNNHVNCINEWCVGNQFSCRKHLEDRMCYEVEHIIDKNGPELKKYCKNIAANLVMALGKWNKEVGELIYYNYDYSKEEKIDVYGKNIVQLVYNKIKECNKEC